MSDSDFEKPGPVGRTPLSESWKVEGSVFDPFVSFWRAVCRGVVVVFNAMFDDGYEALASGIERHYIGDAPVKKPHPYFLRIVYRNAKGEEVTPERVQAELAKPKRKRSKPASSSRKKSSAKKKSARKKAPAAKKKVARKRR